ncbi:DUF2958 domain-containing protein [Microvirga pakistanensis]|uniref:DUF2958 domain-containing protein n=1 Tax=Microvirga pakistanensis TaxID=1682650 RepID=UPI00106B6A14|nr:DUF2958 domain-containing protein [Microvirga pakistanensis]
MAYKLITTRQRSQLLIHGWRIANGDDPDLPPIVKLFTPDANATWLLVELDPANPDRAWGLCDLGLGCPELGYVSLQEIAALRGRLGLPVERDRRFKPGRLLSDFAAEARIAGRIIA